MEKDYRLIPIWLWIAAIILIVILCGGCFGLGGQKDYGAGKVLQPMKLVKTNEHVYRAVSPTPIKVTPIPQSKPSPIPPGIPVPPKTNKVTVTVLPIPQVVAAPKPKAVQITPKPIDLKPIEPITGDPLEPIQVVQITPKMIEVPQDVRDNLSRLFWYYILALVSLAGAYFGWRRYQAYKASKKPVKRARRRRRKGSSK